ncbi:hypothetical protein PVAP13_6KG409201 [Panicum virgatum]|uniref:Uncharacterized protein n=1 Tax=Panicum virgatum TaxID=38727 RepID=A0A8T0RLX7_PANVG|nr:hypothetical protein PVAP13_6KG409201 [Panicum virgatum]
MMAYSCDRLLTFQAFMPLLSTDSIYSYFMGQSLASPTIEDVWCHPIFVFLLSLPESICWCLDLLISAMVRYITLTVSHD